MRQKLLLSFLLTSLFFASNTQAQNSDPHLKNWIEKEAAWVLSNENPTQFESHLKEIKPFFTKSGFSNYIKAMKSSRADKHSSLYNKACVGTISPDSRNEGFWVAESFLFADGKQKTQKQDDWIYAIDETDFLTVPPKTPTILDVRLLKPQAVKPMGFQIIVTKNPDSQGTYLIDQVIYNPRLQMPSSCAPSASAEEKMELYIKIKAALERDLKIINQKIGETNPSNTASE